ncbi:hypothetical protein H6Y62_07300 [Staphylococcus lugdunensis]|uniref:Uncharacterized protein n=5 Tax=Staphylococcus TaxID=1279 RepID=A0A4Q9WB66_STALU|nr:hypothetical protein [Staphylococcus lugdunensis]ARJ11535.1 hypothetical protein B7466_07030 [Staphylococcus lugdunensis]AST60013.2 hypothetical protein BFP67_04105 [Staphylococcus lugdunensis]ATG70395.1 hypothetical protein CPG32_04850 [Staphylococcus lugdunensis]ATN16156.1 hypothetical protein CRN64_01895 [Staphylococcus lugdunensis]MBM0804237.1 hypothetical protein [Staphylococcus lugdunensis]
MSGIMSIACVFIIWLFLTIFFILVTGNVVIKGETFPLENLWIFIVLWIILFFVIIAFLLYRRYTQKQFAKIIKDEKNNEFKIFDNGEYFYQAPLITIDKQYIPIYGNKNIYYTTDFNNVIQKWMSIIGFFPLFGIFLKSDNHILKIKRIKLLSLRPHYKVYLDKTNIGILQRQKLITEKGMKQQLPYTFYSNKNTMYKFINPYLSMNTKIVKDDKVIFDAHRSFFDLNKIQYTKSRGERHTIQIDNTSELDYPDEVFLGLYIQIMINKRTND